MFSDAKVLKLLLKGVKRVFTFPLFVSVVPPASSTSPLLMLPCRTSAKPSSQPTAQTQSQIPQCSDWLGSMLTAWPSLPPTTDATLDSVLLLYGNHNIRIHQSIYDITYGFTSWYMTLHMDSPVDIWHYMSNLRIHLLIFDYIHYKLWILMLICNITCM